MNGNGHHEIIGRSGFGKSNYLEHLILNWTGGFVFIDPHGQSAERIADTLEVIHLKVGHTNFGFNPLENIATERRPLVASQILSSLKAIWADSWGPRMNAILYHALRLALDNNLSLLDIPTILTDKPYRTRCLLRSSYVDFWLKEFEVWKEKDRNDYIQPVMNKLGMFRANPTLANILGKNTLSLNRIVEKEQRLVVNLSKASLGEEPAYLLGSLIIAGLYNASQKRPFNPAPFRIFADEFQNFATDAFDDILSEARKYGLFLTIAHQYLEQIPDDLLPSIYANVSTVTAFNVSAKDAEFLGKEMDLHPSALTDLSKYEYWIKIGLWRERKITLPPVATLGKLKANMARTGARYT